MSVVIVDASVAAKWYLKGPDEALKEEAFGLLHRYVRADLRLTVPDIFFAEVANVLWKAVRSGRISKSVGVESLALLAERKIPTASSTHLLQPAFAIATAFNRTVYDGLYVALAIESNGQFVTADQKLVHTLTPHCPVRWLGAF